MQQLAAGSGLGRFGCGATVRRATTPTGWYAGKNELEGSGLRLIRRTFGWRAGADSAFDPGLCLAIGPVWFGLATFQES